MENPSLPHYHGEEPAHTEVVRQMLEKEDTFQELSDIFRQLGDANRIRIFWLLCHCEECVVNIAAMMDMSSPAVSHHLRILRDSGLLTAATARRSTTTPPTPPRPGCCTSSSSRSWTWPVPSGAPRQSRSG